MERMRRRDESWRGGGGWVICRSRTLVHVEVGVKASCVGLFGSLVVGESRKENGRWSVSAAASGEEKSGNWGGGEKERVEAPTAQGER